MDVKDLSIKPETKRPLERGSKATNPRATLTSLVASTVGVNPTDKISVPEKSSSNPQNVELRKRLNEVISHVNVAEESTAKITEFVQSIGGLAEQVSTQEVTPERKAKLEKEGNELLDAIKRTAQTESSNGIKPLAGDEIRVEIEQKLGKALDAILPDDAKRAFGLKSIDFSTKDSIISTVTKIKEAEVQLQKLRDAVSTVSKNVKNYADEIDVALQNQEASQVSVRDVDEALKLAHSTGKNISDAPQVALNSFSTPDENALGLLKQ